MNAGVLLWGLTGVLSTGVFVTHGDVGVGTIVGSAVFNILCIIGVCGIFAGKVCVRELQLIDMVLYTSAHTTHKKLGTVGIRVELMDNDDRL